MSDRYLLLVEGPLNSGKEEFAKTIEKLHFGTVVFEDAEKNADYEESHRHCVNGNPCKHSRAIDLMLSDQAPNVILVTCESFSKSILDGYRAASEAYPTQSYKIIPVFLKERVSAFKMENMPDKWNKAQHDMTKLNKELFRRFGVKGSVVVTAKDMETNLGQTNEVAFPHERICHYGDIGITNQIQFTFIEMIDGKRLTRLSTPFTSESPVFASEINGGSVTIVIDSNEGYAVLKNFPPLKKNEQIIFNYTYLPELTDDVIEDVRREVLSPYQPKT